MEDIPGVVQTVRNDIGVQNEQERQYFEQTFGGTEEREVPVVGVRSEAKTRHEPHSGAIVYKDHGEARKVPVSAKADELRPFDANRQMEGERNTQNDIDDPEQLERQQAARIAATNWVMGRGAKIPGDR